MDNSPLNSIPAELRNRIYEYALHENGSVAISPNFITEPGLLRTCKQVRAEAELLFYAVNRFTAVCPFRADGADHLIHWLEHKNGKRLELMQRLTIRIEGPGVAFPRMVVAYGSPYKGHTENPLATYWCDLPAKLKKLDIGRRRPETFFYFKCNGMSDENPFKRPLHFRNWHSWLEQCTCWVPSMSMSLGLNIPDGMVTFGPTFNRGEQSDLRIFVEHLHETRQIGEADFEHIFVFSDLEEQSQDAD